MTNKPAHNIRLGALQAAIWTNTHDGKTFHNVTYSRSYKDGNDQWQDSDSFGRDDLLPLAKLSDLAHTWIMEQQKSKENWTDRAARKPSDTEMHY